MKLLLDFFPIVLFFIFYKNYGINSAIIAMIIATSIQILYTRFKIGYFEKAQIITFVLLLIFGGLTLWINDPIFIMWKVSILYVVFALVLIVSLFTKMTLLEKMLQKQIKLPQQVWRKVTILWASGFGILAIVNGYFVEKALNASDKFFQTTGLEKIQLSEIDCTTNLMVELCNIAKITENSWVNFKLFGTLGATFVLLLITFIFINKYIKK